MAEVEILASTVPAPVEPSPVPVEPPHTLPGTATAEPETPDDGQPLDDVVDEDSHQPRSRGSRAKSKMAAARINKLAEQNWELKQKLEALERATKKPESATPQHAYQVPKVPTGTFAEPEPQLEQFADKDDPYGAWQRALARYDRRKEEHEQALTHQQAHVQQLSQQQQEYWNGVVTSHQQRLVQAVQANPQIAEAFRAANERAAPPPLLDRAIMLDNDSVNVALFLATNPAVLDEFVLMTAAQPVTEQTVAITRRLLRQRMSAGTTGSVAPSPLPNAPRPPNPVRTGAIRAGNEPPDVDTSIAEHAKFYAPKR